MSPYSHPITGAWIETDVTNETGVGVEFRTQSRVRGLKQSNQQAGRELGNSHPITGAWIETILPHSLLLHLLRSHPITGAWIETDSLIFLVSGGISHPITGAWIETSCYRPSHRHDMFAPNHGCVD